MPNAALQIVLRAEGYVVELANSAAEAIRMVGENPPDLVLTDVQMPEAILRNAARIQRLIADVLDESRLRTGRLPLGCGQHLLSQLLADVSELHPLAQLKGVRVDIVPPQRDRLVSGDRGRMSQVLGNLLTNATKFSSTGGTVTVSVTTGETGIRFAVHDEGPGIAPGDLPKILLRDAI